MDCKECGRPMLVTAGWHTFFGIPIEQTTTVYICPVGHVDVETREGL